MVDVRGDVLRPPHGTTPAAVKPGSGYAGGYAVVNVVMQYNDADRFRHYMTHIQHLMI